MPPRPGSAKEIFLDASELPPEEREAFLDRACGEDEALRARVVALLSAQGRADEMEPIRLLPVDLDAGARVGPYRLVERLGQGGFGVVWRAEQEEPVRREVALKVIKLGMDTTQVVRRFDAERQTLARMEHPGIARVFDAGATDQGRPYFAMELVRGPSITEHCAKERPGLRERLRLFVQVCRAVQHAHQKGVIHRDLKPSNILVARHDGRPAPKVIDFGIAKATGADAAQGTLLTEQGQFVGSPAYMSPEQMQLGSQDVDTRTDVYSLGVVLYEMLTGALPYELADSARGGYAEIFRAIREQEPQRPSTRISRHFEKESWTFEAPASRLAPLFRRDLDWIVMKALEKDRARRYESVGAFAADVERFLADEPVEASPPSVLYRLRKTARRHRLTFVTLGTVALALVVGSALALAGYLEARKQARLATERGAVAEQQEQLANEAREVAELEKTHAEEERDRANAVIALLQRLLNTPGSARDKGPDYTVRELLDDYSDELGEDLEDEPIVEATIQATIGNTYLVLDLPAEARPHIVRARELRREHLGPDHTDTLVSDVDFARLLTQEGRVDEAEALFRKTLPALERASDLPPRLLGIARAQMAVALGMRGAYDEAAELLQRAFENVEEQDVLGQAVLTNNLGLFAERRGDFAEAVELYHRSLALHDEARSDPVERAKTISNLGTVEMSLGQLEESERHLREALAAFVEYSGEDSALSNRARNNLGRILTVLGRLDEAEPLLDAALAHARANLPPGHPELPAMMSTLSLLYGEQGREDESLELALESLELRRAALGPDHPDLAASLYNTGWMMYESGRLDEAEESIREALRIVLLQEAGRPYRSRVLSGLGLVREAQGELPEALELMARARLASLATGDTATAEKARERAAEIADRIADDLVAASGLLAGDLHEEAEPRVLSALEAAADDAARLHAEVLLGRVRTLAGDPAGAEEHLLAAWEGLAAAGSDDATRRAAGRALLALYESWERPEELEAWRAELARAGLLD